MFILHCYVCNKTRQFLQRQFSQTYNVQRLLKVFNQHVTFTVIFVNIFFKFMLYVNKINSCYYQLKHTSTKILNTSILDRKDSLSDQ